MSDNGGWPAATEGQRLWRELNGLKAERDRLRDERDALRSGFAAASGAADAGAEAVGAMAVKLSAMVKERERLRAVVEAARALRAAEDVPYQPGKELTIGRLFARLATALDQLDSQVDRTQQVRPFSELAEELDRRPDAARRRAEADAELAAELAQDEDRAMTQPRCGAEDASFVRDSEIPDADVDEATGHGWCHPTCTLLPHPGRWHQEWHAGKLRAEWGGGRASTGSPDSAS